MLDERRFAGPEHLDPVYVESYDQKAAYDPTEDLDALRRHGLSQDSLVLDIGAGTGTFAAAVAPLCRQVIAVDVSSAMTAALRASAQANGLGNVTVVKAGFISYEHEGSPVDFVFTRNALHHLPDFWKGVALARVASLVEPGGILRLRDLVFDFEPPEAQSRLEAWFAGAVSDPRVGFTADELATHVRSEFSTYSWILEAMLERVGFSIVDRQFRKSVYGTYTCVRAEP